VLLPQKQELSTACQTVEKSLMQNRLLATDRNTTQELPAFWVFYQLS
jgi:hypothetical protein